MHKIQFTVDKRTEIISIILALSKCNKYVEDHFNLSINNEYQKDVDSFFSKYKNHKSILLAKKIAKSDYGFNYDNLILLAFQLEPNIIYKDKFDKYLSNEIKNIQLTKDFLHSIEDFAKTSNFEDFYKKSTNYYNAKITELNEIFDDKKFLSILKEEFKTEPENKFTVNLIPLLINSNHGFENDDVYYANIGLPCENFKKIDNFNNGYSHLIIHEFLHPFVNHNTEKFSNVIGFNFNEELKAKVSKMGYISKTSYISDTIVRALTIRIREKLDNIDVEIF